MTGMTTARRPAEHPPTAGGRVEFGYRGFTLRTGLVSARLPVRLLSVSLGLFVAAILAALVAIQLGEYPITTAQVFAALVGQGEEFQRKVVLEWRLPIAVAAVVFGALLGIGGAIFQSLTRNPLGSPDVIGFDTGSYTAVVIMFLVVDSRNSWSISFAAIVGGLLTATVVYLLAYRRGIQGFRLIIVGIAVAAVLGSINSYLITRAEIDDAIAVGFWGAGSLGRVTWTNLVPALCLAGLIVVGAALLAPALRRLEMGDDLAVALGTRPNRVRLILIVLGVATTALVTAAAGPIGFIALVAPQLARRLTRSAGVSLLAAAAMGAALLVAAQLTSLVVSEFFRPIPVGLLTVVLGGCYLIWLLIHETRRQYGMPR